MKARWGVIAWVIWFALLPVQAQIYRYVDDDGVVRFTDDAVKIPAEHAPKAIVLPSVKIQPDAVETSGEPVPTPASETKAIPSLIQEEAVPRERPETRTTRIQQLEQEYGQLLKQKQVFEENRSYQKRKIKRKYKHRPSIKAKIDAERKIDQRMQEVASQLDQLGVKVLIPARITHGADTESEAYTD